jgi:hypothetical protein
MNICGVIIFIDQKFKIASLQDIRQNIINFLWNNKILLNPLYINIHWIVVYNVYVYIWIRNVSYSDWRTKFEIGQGNIFL